MIIINLLLFILSGIGITNLVVNATILDGIRTFLGNRSLLLRKLLSCMMCSGFWVGFFLAWFFKINPVIAGATISLFGTIFSYFFEYIELLIALKAKQLEFESNNETEYESESKKNENVD